MKIFYKIFAITLLLTFISCSSEKEKFCIINGTVTDSEIKSILLVKPGQFLDSGSLLEIPVVNGKFQYKKSLKFPESVELFLGAAKNVGGRAMPLFLENEKINLTVNPENDFDKNSIEGGHLNELYKKYKAKIKLKFENQSKVLWDSISVLIKNNQYYSLEMKNIQTKIKEAKSKEDKMPLWEQRTKLVNKKQHLTPKGFVINNKLEDINKAQKKWQQAYINQNPTIISYYLFLNQLVYTKESIDINQAKENLKNLSKSNSNHPYNDLATNLLNAIDNIKVGKQYIDFQAPDLNGKMIKLSEKIKGKITLLNLWGSWCGPCIIKTRTMVPLYNEFKDRGFTIIGVAGEFKNTDRMVTFLNKEKWPWLNLVEIDRENNIWNKYNVDGSGGGMILIDDNGEILALEPKAEEIRKILEVRLN